MSDIDWDLLSSYAGLLTLASVSIYAGSFGSLVLQKSKPSASALHAEDDDDEDNDNPDRMSFEDAYLFPIIGSVVLFGMYIVVKYFGKEWINWLLGWYFSLAGVGSVWKSLIALTRLAVGDIRWKKFEKIHILALKGPKELVSLSLRTPSIGLLPLGAIPSILYTFTTAGRKSVLLTDVLGLSFAHSALSLLRLDSFKTGSVLLTGLFVYDVWWVFGTEVMVKVATTLDVPIKLMWPKSLTLEAFIPSPFSVALPPTRGYTMLGLGDIVIPGTFVALGLRYDYYRHVQAAKAKGLDASGVSFNKPYFHAALSGYIAGLATTMTVMHVFKAAQPALLYLSPACILSFVITATLRGELEDTWKWSDEPEPAVEATPAESGKKNSDVVAEQEANGEVATGDEEKSEQSDAQVKGKKGKGKRKANL